MQKDFRTYVDLKERIDLIIQREFDSLFGFFSEDNYSFRRDITESSSPIDKINITSTCFCVLAFLEDVGIETRFVTELGRGKQDKIDLRKRIAKLLRDTRESKEWVLEENQENNHNNVYTASIATTTLRLLDPDVLTPEDIDEAKRLLKKISVDGAVSYGEDPPHAFLSFWCALAVMQVILACRYQSFGRTEQSDKQLGEPKGSAAGESERSERLKSLMELEKECFSSLRRLLIWAEKEVNKQIAYDASEEIDKFDPAQLAYCLAMLELAWSDLRIRSGLEGIGKIELGVLQKGIDLVFEFQRGIGLWPKFNHILHTQEQGSIYPFAIQMLDALLSIANESNFGLFEKHIAKLSDALRWIEENTIEYSYQKKTQVEMADTIHNSLGWGWRSNFLPYGQPQSWSTAAVFSTLAKMRRFLNLIIKDSILTEFDATRIATPNPQPLLEIIDSTVPQERRGVRANYSLIEVVKKYFIKPRATSKNFKTEEDLKISAIFFGPTGTRKTGLAKAIAFALGWDFVKIYMGDFLVEGESNIAARAGYIFRRLKELDKTVILIDEVEELIRKREEERTTLSSRLLTTSMLPLLEELHSNKGIIFIATTNYIGEMDDAAIRRGRFDLRLRITPPNLEGKIKIMNDVWARSKQSIQLSKEHLDRLVILVRARYNRDIQYFLYYEWIDFLNGFFGLFRKRPPEDERQLAERFTAELDSAAQHDIMFNTDDEAKKKMRQNFDNLIKSIDLPQDCQDCQTESP